MKKKKKTKRCKRLMRNPSRTDLLLRIPPPLLDANQKTFRSMISMILSQTQRNRHWLKLEKKSPDCLKISLTSEILLNLLLIDRDTSQKDLKARCKVP